MERHRRGHQLALGLAFALAAALALAWTSREVAGAGPPRASSGQARASAVREQLGRLGIEDGSIVVEQVAGSLEEVAARVLEDMRLSGAGVLVRSGYLDLSGSVWSCTVARGSEVEMCFVEETGEGSCELRMVRIGPSDVGDAIRE